LDGSDSTKITLSGSNVTQWSDKSGNNRHATQTSGQNSPTYTAGTNYIQFTANNTAQRGSFSGWNYFDCTGLSALAGSQGFTLFFVIKRDSNKSNSTTSGSYFTGGTNRSTNSLLHCGYLYSTSSPASDRLTLRYWANDIDQTALTFATGEPIKIIRFRHTSANQRTIAINGLNTTTQTAISPLTSWDGAIIGSRDNYVAGSTEVNQGFNGEMYEIIGYNRGLSDEESRQLESYLAWKYRILQDPQAGFGGFTPTSITECRLWFDAADSSTLFQGRTSSLVTAQGQNVRKWNNRISGGADLYDLVGTANNYPKYQNGGVYIFNNNSNNYNAETLCSMQTLINIQTTADYSIMAVIDFADIGTGSSLQTIYSNSRISARRAPQMGCSQSFEVNSATTPVTRTVGSTTFIGTGRRIVELISTASNLLYYNQAPVTPSFTAGALADRYTSDASAFPMIGASISSATSVYDNRLANGTYYEFILYNKALNNTERARLHSYLAKKWGLNVIQNTFPSFYTYLETPTSFKKFSPLDISTCALWIDAADPSTVTTSGGVVTNIRDKSPNNWSLGAASGFTYPNNTFNGAQPSFYNPTRAQNFTLGSSTSIILSQPITAFFVGRKIPSTNVFDGYIFDGLNSTNRIAIYGAQYTMFAGSGLSVPSSTFNDTNVITSTVFNSTSSVLYVNGTQQNSGNVGTNTTAGGLRIGNIHTLNDCWVGHFCELLIFNGTLSIDQIQEVEGYLAYKWELKSSLPSYPTHPFSGTLYPTAPKFEPTNFTNCVFWIDSIPSYNIQTSALNNLLRVTDRSSNSRILSDTRGFIYGDSTNFKFQNTSSTTAIVGKNTSLSIPTPFTIFWVAQRIAGSNGRFLLDGTASTNGAQILDSSGNYTIGRSGVNLITTSVPTTTLGAFNATFASTGQTSSFFVNGVSSATGSGVTFTATGITIGNDYLFSTSAWLGTISEIVILTNITTQQRVAMEGYLAWKWGLVNLLPSTHPFRNTIP
jgi:hypothetical protein